MSKARVLRSAYTPGKRKQVTFEVVDRKTGELGALSRTRQEFAKECDINEIMANYKRTGVVSHVNEARPQYGDFANLPDLHRAMEIFNAAEAAFMQLPAAVRKEYDNDPQSFVTFVQAAESEEDLAKLRSFGLLNVPKPEAPPQKVEVVNQPAAPAAGATQ